MKKETCYVKSHEMLLGNSSMCFKINKLLISKPCLQTRPCLLPKFWKLWSWFTRDQIAQLDDEIAELTKELALATSKQNSQRVNVTVYTVYVYWEYCIHYILICNLNVIVQDNKNTEHHMKIQEKQSRLIWLL